MRNRHKHTKPPRIAEWLLGKSISPYDRDIFLGDMEEFFLERVESGGKNAGYFWYRVQAVKSIPKIIAHYSFWSIIMMFNSIKLTLRIIRKHRLTSSLNILGFAAALACSLFLLFYVNEEFSYDGHITDAERIFRVTNERFEVNVNRHWAKTSPPLAQGILEFFPDIELTGRLVNSSPMVFSALSEFGNTVRFEEDNGVFADSSIVTLLEMPFKAGNPDLAFDTPNAIIVSSSMAKRYFGEEDPLGKTISLDLIGVQLTVTGVFEELPRKSHIHFNYILPMETFFNFLQQRNLGQLIEARTWAGCYTYIKLLPNADPDKVINRMDEFTVDFLEEMGSPEEILANFGLRLQPLRDIHLDTNLEQDLGPRTSRSMVLAFLIIAVFILIIGSVNFINITIAQMMQRIRESGIRQALGAYKGQLIRQFLRESLIITVISGCLSAVMIYLLLHFYSIFSGNIVNHSDILSISNILFAITLLLTV
ncbi:ABC transporter permease, partial [candidate division KSB1 bacterium]